MEPDEYHLMDRLEATMWWYQALHNRVENVLRRLVPRPGTLLDAGCGTGGLLARLARTLPVHSLVGLELDELAARRARDKSGARVAGGTVNALPFGRESFDAVLSVDVLCHAGVDESKTLGDAFQCLKPDGIIVLNLPAFQWMLSDHDVRVHNVRRFTKSDATRMLAASGFRLVSVSYWNSLLFPLMVLRRKLMSPGDAGSDVQEYPATVNRLFLRILAVEGWLAGAGVRFPFGGSVLAIGMKPHV